MAIDHGDASEVLKDSYSALMLSYAAGRLDQAQSLIVSSHITLSPLARRLISNYEMIGGALLEKECSPVAMNSGSLDRVLGKLNKRECEAGNIQDCDVFAENVTIPEILKYYISRQRKIPNWKPLYPGFSTFELSLDCKKSKARFIKADPAVKTPGHAHKDIEITLVLDGAFEDGDAVYSKGDLIVREVDSRHAPVACAKNGCVCMVVSSKPIKLTGLARLLNPFIRI